MEKYVSTQDIVKKMIGKVLGGAKTPHTCSFPVLRKIDGKFVIALFTQLYTREQISRKVVQRPSYWCCADIQDGSNFKEYNCKETDFCTAPYDRLYSKGVTERVGTRADVDSLYNQMDDIRKHYIATGVIDAFSYKEYLTELFKIVPSGQINFYKELSKMV